MTRQRLAPPWRAGSAACGAALRPREAGGAGAADAGVQAPAAARAGWQQARVAAHRVSAPRRGCTWRAPRVCRPARPSRAAARRGRPRSATAAAEAAQGSRRQMQKPGLSILGRHAARRRPPGGSAAATRPAPARAPPRASRVRAAALRAAHAPWIPAWAWPTARPCWRHRAARTTRPAQACQPASTVERVLAPARLAEAT